MKIDPMELARAELALQSAVGRFLFDRTRQINLIDIGQYEKDGKLYNRLAIRYHVDQYLANTQLEAIGREPLQRQPILDIPAMVIEGKNRLQQWSWWGGGWGGASNSRLSRANPLQGGVSISTEYFGSGTLGCIVRDRASQRNMILSNWHVMVAYWGAPRGQRILQPGRYEGGTTADTIAALERDAMAANLDAAVAFLNDSRGYSSELLGIGPLAGVVRPTFGMEVEKSGRSSAVTYGRVDSVPDTNATYKDYYGGVEYIIRNVFRIVPRDAARPEVSRAGDSGSVWIESATGKAVGLHFAGGDYPEVALALDMQPVLNALNVEIPTSV